MKDQIERNRTPEEGRNDDQGLRDDSAIQPGASTVKKSETDSANERLSKTSGDGFREGQADKNADPRFDEKRSKDGLKP